MVGAQSHKGETIMSKTETGKRKSNAKKSSAQKDVCFTIMPFGGWGDTYYETIFCPAIRAAGLEPHRADDLYRPSTIVNDIWAYTKKAKLLVADLTGKNPNVFYELGLAHAIAKPAILIAESMDEIPYDLRALRIIVYNKNACDWGQLLREKIKAAIKEVLKSPAAAVLPTFLDVKLSSDKPVVTEREKEMIEIKQELDLLRREMRDWASTSEPPTKFSHSDLINNIMRLINMNVPTDVIVDNLCKFGIPRADVENEVAHIKTRQRMQGYLRIKRKDKDSETETHKEG
jgi:hypothetical protein